MIDIDIVEQLIPNPMTMLVQLCSTLVLFLLMKKFLWKSVKNFLDVRADKMQSDLAESEQAKQDALTDRQKALEELQGASARGEKIVEAAVKQAK
ncbi:MAG: ATP synthase F0 subunit B, partial [Bulleidia sp.]|nr:ATP synthase F0 subunit B [Bulleidia sp.]